MVHRLVWLGAFLAISLMIFSQLCLPAGANHENIDVNWQSGVYVHGNMFRTTVVIVTGNLTEHDSAGILNDTSYLVVFKDQIVSQDLPVQIHNETRTINPFSNRTAVYSRPLLEGYWLLSVEVFDARTMQELPVSDFQKTIVVQPIVYEAIRQQLDAAEDQSAITQASFFWTHVSLLVGTVGAIVAAFGGAVIGAHYSRKAVREQWGSTKHDVGNLKIPPDSPEVSRDIPSLQEQVATSQRAAAESLKKSGELQVLLSVFKMVSDLDLSRANARIFVAYCSVYGNDPTETKLKQEQLQKFYLSIIDDVRKVEETFEQVGILVMKDHVDAKLFYDLYASIVIQTFRALEVHIREERGKNPAHGLWYEKLYNGAMDYYKNELHSTPPPIYCRNRVA